MNTFEDLLTSIKRASELSLSIMKPRDKGEVNHGLMIFLFMLYKRGEMKTSDISEHFNVTSGGATGIADKLESFGLIERHRNKVDRRVVTVALSEKGKKLVLNKKKEHVDLYQFILNDLSDNDLLTTINMLNKISDKLETYKNTGEG